MSTEEQTQYFTQLEREKAKTGVTPETLAYIEALENVAKHAYDLWATRGMVEEAECADNLYDSLVCVDFMQAEH
jgi:hypothetical protein